MQGTQLEAKGQGAEKPSKIEEAKKAIRGLQQAFLTAHGALLEIEKTTVKIEEDLSSPDTDLLKKTVTNAIELSSDQYCQLAYGRLESKGATSAYNELLDEIASEHAKKVEKLSSALLESENDIFQLRCAIEIFLNFYDEVEDWTIPPWISEAADEIKQICDVVDDKKGLTYEDVKKTDIGSCRCCGCFVQKRVTFHYYCDHCSKSTNSQQS